MNTQPQTHTIPELVTALLGGLLLMTFEWCRSHRGLVVVGILVAIKVLVLVWAQEAAIPPPVTPFTQ